MLPDRKVLAAGIGGVVTWLVTLVAGRYGVDVPADIQSFLPVLVGVVLGYLVPPSARDIVKRLDDTIIKIAAEAPEIPVTYDGLEAAKKIATYAPVPKR